MNPFSGEQKNPLASAKIIAENVAPEVYLRQEPGVDRGNPAFVMQRSSLMSFASCPHKWLAGWDREDSAASDWGSGLDCLTLTPFQWEDRFAVKPETYPAPPTHADVKKGLIAAGDPLPWNGNAKICQEWLKNQGARILFTAEKHTQLENAAKFIFGNQEIADLIYCSRKQIMVGWEYRDKSTGIQISGKCLMDLVPDAADPVFGKVLADLKSTTNASRSAWTNKVFDEGYNVQAALFLDAYTLATGEDRCDWWHIVQESGPPWETLIWPLSIEFVELGRDNYVRALERYCQCLKTNAWPSYDNGIRTWISPKPWMVQEINV